MNVSVSTIVDEMHTYEPANGHGLRHDPFNAIIAPRPIGWMSTMGAKGNLNLAPYSFFNAFNYKPPILAFSSTGWKDTVRNIEETREFVWNLATMPLAQAMNITSAGVPPNVSESLIVDGVYMTALAHPIARAGRKGDYFEATPDRMFDMPRPD